MLHFVNEQTRSQSMHGTRRYENGIPGLDVAVFNDIQDGLVSNRGLNFLPGHTGTEAADELCTRVRLHHIPGLCFAIKARARQAPGLFVVRMDLQG